MKKIIDDIRLIFKCCSLYYQDGLSQQEISDILQISRPSVARMIKNGHQQGIVKIEVINPNNLLFGNLERALEKKFNLEEVIVTPATNSNLIDDVDETMANEVFKFLSRILNENDYVGIGMGRTLRNLIKNKCQVEPLKCTFVPTMGGIDKNRYDIHSIAINAQVGADFVPVGLSLGEAEPETIELGIPAVLYSRLITGPAAVIIDYLFSMGLYS